MGAKGEFRHSQSHAGTAGLAYGSPSKCAPCPQCMGGAQCHFGVPENIKGKPVCLFVQFSATWGNRGEGHLQQVILKMGPKEAIPFGHLPAQREAPQENTLSRLQQGSSCQVREVCPIVGTFLCAKSACQTGGAQSK